LERLKVENAQALENDNNESNNDMESTTTILKIEEKEETKENEKEHKIKRISKYTHSELVEYVQSTEHDSAMKPWVDVICNNLNVDGKKYVSFGVPNSNNEDNKKSLDLQDSLQSLRGEELVSLTAFLMKKHLDSGLSLPPIGKEPIKRKRLEERIEELEKEIDEMEEYLCDICQDAPKTEMFIPCRHLACDKCAKSIKTCPRCRADIEQLVKTFY